MLAVVSDSRAEDSRWSQDNPPADRRKRDLLARRHGGDWTARVRWASSQPPPRRATEKATELLAAWRTTVDPYGQGLFDRRLGRDGLSEGQALLVMGDDGDPSEPEPDWWSTYRSLVSVFDAEDAWVGTDEDWLERMSAEIPAGTGSSVPFVHLLWPVVADAWDRLASVHDSLFATVTPVAADHLRRGLLVRLSMVATPCLSDLMWQSVPFGRRFLAESGPVQDNPPREHYARFCRAQADDGLSSVLTRFPVLGGLLARVVQQWARVTVEMLERLAVDRPALAAKLGIPQDAPLTEAMGAAGDTHNAGRSVSILGFGDTRVVYKPRSVALEELYHRHATALSTLTPDDPLRAVAVLARTDADGDYGYCEYVSRQPCTTDDELRRFYRNAGRTLALLHVLAATDCHHENLIAVGDQLVPVDGETLFDTAPPPTVPQSATADASNSTGIPASVQRVGILPTWLWLDGRRTALDVSALGVAPGSVHPIERRGWRSINSDLMARGDVEMVVDHPTSLPTATNTAAAVGEYVDDVVDGFTGAYRSLAARADALSQQLSTETRNLSRRLVTRPTYVYASLLGASLEPEALTSAQSRGLVLERLTRALLHDEATAIWPMVAAEQDALTRLDVPYFQVGLGGAGSAASRRTEWLDGGLSGWPDIDSEAEIEARCASLSEADLEWQSKLIRASVAASRFRLTPGSSGSEVRGDGASFRADGMDRGQAQEAGLAALTAVTESSVTIDGQRTWMGVSLLPDGVRANLQTIGSGLYDGRMGLAVALAAWAAVDGEHTEEAAAAADAAVGPLLELLHSGVEGDVVRLAHANGLGIGGVGGLLRGLAFLGGMSDDDEFAEASATLIRGVPTNLLRDDNQLDLMSGAAGLIAPLVPLVLTQTDGDAERLLRAAAEVLRDRQDPDTGGWRTELAATPLTGLAHGASGIAVALAEAALVLDDASLMAAAVKGLDYEARTFDRSAGNWPDFRVDARESGFMMGWCAGAPGIALTRLRLLQILPEAEQVPRWRDEMVVAADTTARAQLVGRDHLCCGNLGRAAILRMLAASASGDAAEGDLGRQWSAAADSIVAAVLRQQNGSLPRSMFGAALTEIPLPGLFTGLPGAGLVLIDADPLAWVPQLML